MVCLRARKTEDTIKTQNARNNPKRGNEETSRKTKSVQEVPGSNVKM